LAVTGRAGHRQKETLEIGQPKRTIVIEPIEDPVPRATATDSEDEPHGGVDADVGAEHAPPLQPIQRSPA
jgi:hypothetical protein